MLAAGIVVSVAGCHRGPPALAQGLPGAAPPPPRHRTADGTPVFVGRWAASSTACERDPWVFKTGGLTTTGALSCTFDSFSPTVAGYVANGVCTVGKASSPMRLTMTLTGADSSRSMTISGGPFAEPVALAPCADRALQAEAVSDRSARGG